MLSQPLTKPHVAMTYLLLCMVLNSSVFICFKSYDIWRIPTFQAIVINYLVCVLTGGIFVGDWAELFALPVREAWFWLAVGLGGIFILTFYLMALTTQRASVAVATVANKMSMVIPVVAGVWMYADIQAGFGWWKWLGILLAIMAVLFTAQERKQPTRFDLRFLWLPLAIFLLGGLLETAFGFGQRELIPEGKEAYFSIYIFASAAITGGIILAIQLAGKAHFDLKSIIGGFYLGIPNYFSIYTLVMALKAYQGQVTIVFPSINVGTILASTLLSILFFKEMPTFINWIGIALAIFAIIILNI